MRKCALKYRLMVELYYLTVKRLISMPKCFLSNISALIDASESNLLLSILLKDTLTCRL